METRNSPPAKGLSAGPIIVACQWNISSPTGPVYKHNIILNNNKYHEKIQADRVLFYTTDHY